MHTIRVPRCRTAVWRRLAIGMATVGLILGLAAVPSSAQEAVPTSAANSFNHTAFSKIVPPNGLHIPPRVGSGDADFAGHGPDITASAHLVFVKGGDRMWVRLCLDAVETQPDRTHANGCSGDYQIFQAPVHTCIDTVMSASSETLVYRDTDHSQDEFDGQSANGFVKRWFVMGDTGDDEAGTKTGVFIHTRSLQMNLVNC